jgi:hypothetical protein
VLPEGLALVGPAIEAALPVAAAAAESLAVPRDAIVMRQVRSYVVRGAERLEPGQLVKVIPGPRQG